MAMTRKEVPKEHKPKMKDIAKEVRTKGTSKTNCLRLFDLPPNFFNQHLDAKELYEKSMAQFGSKVMKITIEQLAYSAADRKLLITKLRLMDAEIDLPVKRMKNASDATRNLSFALHAYAKKEITDDTLQQIRSACDTFSSLTTATVLETKIAELEKLFAERGEK